MALTSAMLLSLGIGQSDAFAGHWEVELKASGVGAAVNTNDGSWIGMTDAGLYSAKNVYNWPSRKGVLRDGVKIEGNVWAALSSTVYAWLNGSTSDGHSRVSGIGSVTAVLVWKPAEGKTLETDPPPTKVILLEKVTASAESGHPAFPTSQFWPSITQKVQTKTPPPQASNEAKETTGTSHPVSNSQSLQLIRLDNPKRRAILTLPTRAIAASSAGVAPAPVTKTSQHSVSFSYSLRQDDRDVWISSDIEKSYRKETARDKLPEKDGVIDQSKIRSTTPLSGNGPWAVECERQADGSMEVHSAAEWLAPKRSNDAITNSVEEFINSTPNWYGELGRSYAHHYGFEQPFFEWKLQGGSAEPVTQYELNKNSERIAIYSSFNQSHQLKEGINLGGHVFNYDPAQGTQQMVRQSTLSVKVKETDVSKPALIAYNDYRVNWHPPFDNVTENEETKTVTLPDGTKKSKLSYTVAPAMTTGTIGYSPTTSSENGSLEVWLTPSPWRAVVALNGNDWFVAGVAVTVGTGGLALGIETGVVTATAIGKALPAMGICLGVSGLSYSFTNNSAASEKKQCVNSSASWQQAVRETLESQKNPQDPTKDITADIRVDPPSALNGFTLQQLDDTNFSTNPLWSKCVMTPHIKHVFEYHFYRGDDYDENGYVGEGRAQLTIPHGSPQVLAYYELDLTTEDV